ncbi:hypothetical protein DVH05_015760 [Phytophthora capsici]|nr:hypothetical protein DVH05_015760 [Phytophthora capsici]
MTRDGLTDMQTTILDRILDGSAGSPASNAIPAILDGLVPVPDIPNGNSTHQWIDPRTGTDCTLRLQHAVDYAFAVDGNHPISAALRATIGPSFCRDPIRGDPVPAGSTSQAGGSPSFQDSLPPDHDNSIISLFDQEEPASPARVMPARQTSDFEQRAARQTPAVHVTTTGVAPPAAPPGSRSSGQPTNRSPSLDARIMEQLLDQPDLLARFVQVVSTAKTPRLLPTSTDVEVPRRTSKYAFAPTAVQLAVHNGITAPEHQGKAPSVFVESVIHAAAVRFQPHPGIIIRLYDFQFGMFGLSLLHLAPFGAHQRMAWLNAGGVNMQNFSAGVAAPKPPVASSMGLLVDAARMLCRYAQEFYAQPVRDVLESLLDLVQQLDGWHSWMASDIPHLVFWINSVLEQFRSQVHSSNGDIHTASLQTIARLSLNDGELQNVMHALSRCVAQDLHRQDKQQQRLSPPSRERGSPEFRRLYST